MDINNKKVNTVPLYKQNVNVVAYSISFKRTKLSLHLNFQALSMEMMANTFAYSQFHVSLIGNDTHTHTHTIVCGVE